MTIVNIILRLLYASTVLSTLYITVESYEVGANYSHCVARQL